MLIFVVIGAPSAWVLWNRHGIRDAAGGGIHRISSVALRHGIAPQQLTTWRRAARQGRLALPEDPVVDEGFGFAALLVAEEPAAPPRARGPAPAPVVDIMSGDVVIRLDGATPAARIAEIAAEPGACR